jgi:hypothetical protein
VIVERPLLPKGRKRDDLRLEYDVSAVRGHLQAITRLLQDAHGGQVPIVRYDPSHPKAEQLGAERYFFPVERAPSLDAHHEQPDPPRIARCGAGRSVQYRPPQANSPVVDGLERGGSLSQRWRPSPIEWP